MELEAKKLAEERRRYTLKVNHCRMYYKFYQYCIIQKFMKQVVEEEVRKEMQAKDEKDLESGILSVLTDAEDEELEYESWKLRELKRNKRDRDEREAEEKRKRDLEKESGSVRKSRHLGLRT